MTDPTRPTSQVWDERPRFALDADVTVYWPDVRPCYDCVPEHDWREQPDGWVVCQVCGLHVPDVFEDQPCADLSDQESR